MYWYRLNKTRGLEADVIRGEARSLEAIFDGFKLCSCASVATPPLPGLQVILLKDTGHLGGCSLGPSVSGVGEVEMVWTEIEVASRSWLMATPLRLRFLGHPTCSHHVVV